MVYSLLRSCVCVCLRASAFVLVYLYAAGSTRAAHFPLKITCSANPTTLTHLHTKTHFHTRLEKEAVKAMKLTSCLVVSKGYEPITECMCVRVCAGNNSCEQLIISKCRTWLCLIPVTCTCGSFCV